MVVWSVGIVAGIYQMISRQDLQSSEVQRNFGYLLEGYEPRSWWWEVIVKKFDLLTTAVITYTSVASDVRAKLILYAAQSSVATSVQLAYSPFDDRQLSLLDRVEILGLMVRNIMFTGVAFCLLFSTTPSVTMVIAGFMLAGNFAFLGKLAMHGADDWVATQWVMLQEARALELREMKKNEKKKAAALEKKKLEDAKKEKLQMLSAAGDEEEREEEGGRAGEEEAR